MSQKATDTAELSLVTIAWHRSIISGDDFIWELFTITLHLNFVSPQNEYISLIVSSSSRLTSGTHFVIIKHSLLLFRPLSPFFLQEPQTTVIHNPVDGIKVHPPPLPPSLHSFTSHPCLHSVSPPVWVFGVWFSAGVFLWTPVRTSVCIHLRISAWACVRRCSCGSCEVFPCLTLPLSGSGCWLRLTLTPAESHVMSRRRCPSAQRQQLGL